MNSGENKIMWRLFLTALFVSVVASAQTTPTLHSRRQTKPEAATRAAKTISAIPANASGEYELDGKGSVIQITIEHSRLDGYITKMDHDTALTLFFEQAAVNGNHLSFTTRTVHELHYSFHGTIVRGDAESPSVNGFYRLVGDLTAHDTSGDHTERVSLRSTPRD